MQITQETHQQIEKVLKKLITSPIDGVIAFVTADTKKYEMMH